MARYRKLYGKWWMIQWVWNWCIDAGFHFDPRRKYSEKFNVWYGPYVDFHIAFFLDMTISLGFNPRFTQAYEILLSDSRGGFSA